MTADLRPLDETIRDAIEAHGVAVDAPVPAFGSILAERQRDTRRMLAAATLVVALVGIGGVVLATSRTHTPGNAVSTPLDESASSEIRVDDTDVTTSPPTTRTPIATPTEFFCSNPLGEDELGRSLFGSCVPAPDEEANDFACTDRIGTDDTGRVRFSTCIAVGQLGPLPGEDGDQPFDGTDELPVRTISYDVQPGDFGFAVAVEFCVSVDDLEAANGWTDATVEFPFPGSEILIPDGFDDSTCDIGSYTITSDDTTRTAVADRFCVSVHALDAANRQTEGYGVFYPGLVIEVPPSFDATC